MASDIALTLGDAITLASLITGVQKGSRAEWFPNGETADRTVDGVLRSFARKGGGFWPHDQDVREAFVHVSGTFEHWLPVRDVLTWMGEGVFVIG